MSEPPTDKHVNFDEGIDGHSSASDEDGRAVEVVFDPANPYRRKSSLVSSEAVPPRLRSTHVPPTEKAQCLVHHFIEAQRLGLGLGGNHEHRQHGSGRLHHHLGRGRGEEDNDDDNDTASMTASAATSTPAIPEEGVGEAGQAGTGQNDGAYDTSEEQGLHRAVDLKGPGGGLMPAHRAPHHHLHGHPQGRRHTIVDTGTSDSDVGQVDEQVWTSGIVQTAAAASTAASTASTPPEEERGGGSSTATSITGASAAGLGRDYDRAVSEQSDTLHSRLLTKRQLSEMAWGVRELSRRLGSLRLRFRVKTIFLLTKIYDEDLLPKTRALARWLLSHERDVRYTVYVERALRTSRPFSGLLEEVAAAATKAGHAETPETLGRRLRVWDEAMCRARPHTFDFVITLGGDGTVLYASWLFQRIVPPVLSFSLGSLGFLTKFDFDEYESTLTRAFAQGVTVSLRLRFEATIMRSQRRRGGAPLAAGGGRRETEGRPGEDGIGVDGTVGTAETAAAGANPEADAEAEPASWRRRDLVEELIGEEKDDEHTHRPDGTYEILNEVVVDRGPNASGYPSWSFLPLCPACSGASLTSSHVLHRDLWRRRALHVRAGRRHLRVDADRLDGLQPGGRRLAVPPREPGDAGDVDLRAHAVVPPHHPARHHRAARGRAVRRAHQLVGQLRRARAPRAAAGRLRDHQRQPLPVCDGAGAGAAERGLGQLDQWEAGVEHAAEAEGVQVVGDVAGRETRRETRRAGNEQT